MKRRLTLAVELAGGQQTLAKFLGVGRNNVWNWLNRDKRAPPAEHCLAIEVATEGQVTAKQLRPDVFCPPSAVL